MFFFTFHICVRHCPTCENFLRRSRGLPFPRNFNNMHTRRRRRRHTYTTTAFTSFIDESHRRTVGFRVLRINLKTSRIFDNYYYIFAPAPWIITFFKLKLHLYLLKINFAHSPRRFIFNLKLIFYLYIFF